MVSSHTRAPGRGSICTAKSRRSPNSERKGSTKANYASPRSRLHEIICMEVVQQQYTEKGFSQEAAEAISASRRPSTHAVYNARIRAFNGWCDERGISPRTAPVKVVADFLLYLHRSKGFKIATITGYRSAIASIHSQGQDIGCNRDLSRLLKGLFNLKPEVRSMVPNWNLPLVLLQLIKQPFEPLEESSLKWLTLKTVFLVAVASASRVSELHALSVEANHMRWERGGVRLLPNLQFLAKNQRLSRPWEPIFIPKFSAFATEREDLLLCPYRALKTYVDKTQSRRGDKTQLFLTYQPGRCVPASKDSIARWIVTVVKACYESAGDQDITLARAHDTRRLSTSWALFSGAPVSDILKAAHWAQETTFTSFYLKDVPLDEMRFARAAIQRPLGGTTSVSRRH